MIAQDSTASKGTLLGTPIKPSEYTREGFGFGLPFATDFEQTLTRFLDSEGLTPGGDLLPRQDERQGTVYGGRRDPAVGGAHPRSRKRESNTTGPRIGTERLPSDPSGRIGSPLIESWTEETERL